MYSLIIALFVISILPKIGHREEHLDKITAARCAFQQVIPAERASDYLSASGEASFRFAKDGVPGTNEKDSGISLILLYSRDDQGSFAVHVHASENGDTIVEPNYDILHRTQSGKWGVVDVGGGPATASATAAYLDKLDRREIESFKPSKNASCKLDQ
jgi:hypothetical protein